MCEPCLLTPFPGLFSCVLYTTWAHLPMVGTAFCGLSPLMSISSQVKCTKDIPASQPDGDNFFMMVPFLK